VRLHHQRAASVHEPAGGLLRDRRRECGAGQFERAADRQRLFALYAVVRSWGLSGNVLLNPSLSGFDRKADLVWFASSRKKVQR
jgi:hypothetical protein